MLSLMALPVAAGLIGAISPAFGWLPPLGLTEPSLDPWRALFAQPGIGRAVLLSLSAGLLSAAIALGAVFLFLAAASGSWIHRLLQGAVSPLLSVPHAAAALGLAFLIAPSGWIARLLSPWATGWERPPDLLIVGDPLGLSMTAALVMKEIPFLLLLSLAALPQLDADRRVRAARAMGYAPTAAWLKTVAPGLYPLIRLPVYPVIAYAASVVDVALILGPGQPPTLAVSILRWMNDPALEMRLMASAAAVLQLGVVLAALGVWRIGEFVVGRLWLRWAAGGGRGRRANAALAFVGVGVVAVCAAALVAGLISLAIASVAGFWRFPDALPSAWTPRHWIQAADGLSAQLWSTAALALVSAGVSLALVVALLESEARRGDGAPTRGSPLLYAPLIAPQVSFLFGLTVGAEALGAAPGFWLVAAGHVVFVLPYVYLSLAGAYRRFDPRWERAARSLGAAPAAAFWRVRAPMLLGPGVTALAVGLAVSIGQYLPTQLLGAGRVTTVTTEAVALAAGGDRRVIGVWALAQALLPAIGFWLALALPRLVWRRRRGMRSGL